MPIERREIHRLLTAGLMALPASTFAATAAYTEAPHVTLGGTPTP